MNYKEFEGHTKGKWWYDRGEIVCKKGSIALCITGSSNKSCKEIEANINLLAASSKLLKQNIKMREFVESIQDFYGNGINVAAAELLKELDG